MIKRKTTSGTTEKHNQNTNEISPSLKTFRFENELAPNRHQRKLELCLAKDTYGSIYSQLNVLGQVQLKNKTQNSLGEVIKMQTFQLQLAQAIAQATAEVWLQAELCLTSSTTQQSWTNW